MAGHIGPGGVFAMWSDGLPLEPFVGALESAFVDVKAEVIEFDNPLQGKKSESTVYVARRESK